MPLLLILSLLFFVSSVYIGAMETDYTFDIDWSTGQMHWEIRAELDQGMEILASSRTRMEQQMESAFPEVFIETVLPLLVDREHRIEDLLHLRPELRGKLIELARNADLHQQRFSTDFHQWKCEAELSLYPELASILLEHKEAQPPRRQLSLSPVSDYTGILIYLEKQLPVHGLHLRTEAEQALFPRILNERMEEIITVSMIDPKRVAQQGMLSYYREEDADLAEGRAGPLPLRIAAGELFGTHPCDIVIPDDAAAQILASEHNIDLIRRGRIAVILGEH